MNQATRFRSSEEERRFEEASRNEARKSAWRMRYLMQRARYPDGSEESVRAHRRR